MNRKNVLIICIAGLIVGFFPWLFSFQGSVAGHRVSLRAAGDIVGIMLVVGGLLTMVSEKKRAALFAVASEADNAPVRNQQVVLWTAVALFAAGAAAHKLRAHYVVGTHAFDLGFFSNICWNTADGRWFYSSELERNFMGVHVNWILWPLSFFYRFWPGAEVLLVGQALIMSSALPILWSIARKVTGSFTAGGLAALLLACSPYFNHTLSNDFHPDVWQLPCLLLMLGAWLDKKPVWMLVFAALALLAKEDVSVVVCGFGAALVLKSEWRRWAVGLLIIGLGAFLFHTQVVTPASIGTGTQSLLFTRYPMLGESYSDIVRNLFVHPSFFFHALINDPMKYWRFFCYFLPVGGLTFLEPFFLIPPVVSVLPHLLSQSGPQLSLAEIYSLPSQPFVFIGGLLGAKKLWSALPPEGQRRLPAALLIIGGIGVLNSPRYFRSQPAARIDAFRQLRSLVPREAPVAAQQNLQPHFSSRRFIEIFPIGDSFPPLKTRYFENPAFIVCDRIGNALPYTGEMVSKAIALLEQNPAYEKILERENFVLFRRRNEEALIWNEISHK